MSRRNFGVSKPLTTRHFWHNIKTRDRLAGLGKLTPHDFRRTAFTKAFQQNVPVTSILNISKHKTVETLIIYDKRMDNLASNALHQINYDEDF